MRASCFGSLRCTGGFCFVIRVASIQLDRFTVERARNYRTLVTCTNHSHISRVRELRVVVVSNWICRKTRESCARLARKILLRQNASDRDSALSTKTHSSERKKTWFWFSIFMRTLAVSLTKNTSSAHHTHERRTRHAKILCAWTSRRWIRVCVFFSSISI